MNFYPAIFEFISTTELLVVAVVALIIFGPRKLPEIGRTIGKSLGEFKRASEDFKRTWEREVEFERIERDLRLPNINVNARDTAATSSAARVDDGTRVETEAPAQGELSIVTTQEESVVTSSSEEDEGRSRQDEQGEPPSKHDWL